MRVIERIIVCFHPFAPRTSDLSATYALHVINRIPPTLPFPPIPTHPHSVGIMHSFPYAQPGTACTFLVRTYTLFPINLQELSFDADLCLVDPLRRMHVNSCLLMSE